MEGILCYTSSDSDDEPEVNRQSITAAEVCDSLQETAAVAPDYFGLEDSSDDEQTTNAARSGVDIFINAFQVSDIAYGPVKLNRANIFHKRKLTHPYSYKRPTEEIRNTTDFSPSNDDDNFTRKPNSKNNGRNQKSKSKTLQGHCGNIDSIKWNNPQFSQLLLSASMDKTVRIWDTLQEKCVACFENHNSAVRSATWNLTGTKVLSGGYDKHARLTDVTTDKELNRYRHQSVVSVVLWHPKDDNVFLTGSLGRLNCWDVRIGDLQAVRTYESNCGQILDAVFFPEGSQFVCSTDIVAHDSADRTLMAWDFSSTAILSNQIYQERYTCPQLDVHPSGNHFVAQSNGDYIAEFSAFRPYKMNKRKRFADHKVSGYNVGCAFNNSGQLLFSGSADGQLVSYDFKSSRVIRKYTPFPRKTVTSVACHSTLDNVVAASTCDGKIHIFH